jgi:hypothetical protein
MLGEILDHRHHAAAEGEICRVCHAPESFRNQPASQEGWDAPRLKAAPQSLTTPIHFCRHHRPCAGDLDEEKARRFTGSGWPGQARP